MATHGTGFGQISAINHIPAGGMMISTRDAAEILRVSPRRVRALITAGKLPAEKVGRDWVINEMDLEDIKSRKPGRPKMID